MPLSEAEIMVGAIAYFDVESLNKSATISGDPVKREATGNQFVCYQVNGSESFWAPLTGTHRPERLRIDASWVSNGYGPLARGEVYLQDGKNTYKAAHSALVASAAGEAAFQAGRPQLSQTGIDAIRKVIKQRRGQF